MKSDEDESGIQVALNSLSKSLTHLQSSTCCISTISCVSSTFSKVFFCMKCWFGTAKTNFQLKKKTFILSKCPGLLSFLINLLSTPAQFLFLKKILNFYFICLKTFFGGPGIPETGEELFVAGSNWIQTALIPLLNRCFTVLH